MKHSEVSQDRVFFCSELVAKAFKVIGVLKDENERSSGSYLPGSFEQGGTIDSNLEEDVVLGSVLNINII